MRFEPLRIRRADGYVSWPSRLRQGLAFAAVGAEARLQHSPTPLYLVRTDEQRSKARLIALGFSLFLFFCLLTLLFPAPALAWGPGAHMVTGNWVLQNLAGLPAQSAEALMRFPGQYLHGILSADIFIGKGSKAKERHSHNWDCGFSLLGKADNLRRRAYALGYLSHLAADTVAHNVYVPGSFNSAPGSGRLAHVYIEMQADASLDWDSLDARGVFHEAGSSASERILRDTVKQKAWKYWLKKHVYERSIAIGGSDKWRGSMALVDRLFPGQARLDMLDYMLTLSTRGIVSVLKDQEHSPVLRFDPIGADALALAARHSEPEINIAVPELMREFPQVCVPEGFVARPKHTEQL